MQTRIVARRSAHRCAYCRANLIAGDVVTCGRCATTYHRACREDLGRCGTMGCIDSRPLAPSVRIDMQRRVAPHEPPSTRLGLLGGIVMFLGLMLLGALGTQAIAALRSDAETERAWSTELSLGRATLLRDEGRFEDALHVVATARAHDLDPARARLADELKRDCERLLVLVPGFERRVASARAFRDAPALARIELELLETATRPVGAQLRPATPLFERLRGRIEEARVELAS